VFDIGRIGIWSAELRSAPAPAVAHAAAEIESLGYGAAWVPGIFDDPFDTAATMLAATHRMHIGAGVVSIWERTAAHVAAATAALNEQFEDRFLLGIGAGHQPLVDRDQPRRYQRPVDSIGRYLDNLDVAETPVPARRRVLAALGPRMLRLAAQRTAGSHPYLVPPEHTAYARELLGEGSLLMPEQAVVLSRDLILARDIARAHVAEHIDLPAYAAAWRRLGFTADDLAGGGSDRLVAAAVAWGEEVIKERVDQHFAAGADHVSLQVLGMSEGQLPHSEWLRLSQIIELKS
jgi:probable F420-dependent oxidoreductase